MKLSSKQPANTIYQPPTTHLNQDRSLPPIFSAIAMVSLFLTVTVGGALFFFPEVSQPRWLWPLKPYNTRFLGAVYLTAAVGFTSLLSSHRSTLVRLIIPMFFVFTANALMVSCLQLQQFSVGRKATDIWFWLYLADCAGSAYYLGYYRHCSFASLRRLPSIWSVALGLQAGLLGAYGLSLLLFSNTTGRTWLWPLDSFHSQLYSSILLSGAVGAAILSRRSTPAELMALGAIQVAFSSLVITGVWLVDKDIHKVNWSLATSWVWIGVIALLGFIGIGLIGQSIHLKKSAADA